MKNLCRNLLGNKAIVTILVAWAFVLIGVSLFYGTTGLKEGIDNLFAPALQPFAEVETSGTPVASSLAMFRDNRASPECCPSAYSTSTGCICIADEQLKLLQTRGGNRSTGFY
jgi:hypothetical protein